MPNQLAGAEACGIERISLLYGHHGQAGGSRHLNDGAAFAQLAVTGFCFLHQRAVDLGLDPLTVLRHDDSLQGPFAAVCNRDTGVLDLAEYGLCRPGQQRNGLPAGQRALERIGRKQEFHKAPAPFFDCFLWSCRNLPRCGVGVASGTEDRWRTGLLKSLVCTGFSQTRFTATFPPTPLPGSRSGQNRCRPEAGA